LVSIFLALGGFAVLPALALDPNQPPGVNFDLSHYYLQLPVDSSGGTTGTSASVTTAQLLAGFTNAYFYTGPDGAMVFWAPEDGATTSGSSYPRSELREELVPGNTGVNWTPWGMHVQTVQCQVLQVPGTGKVIIGQAKGYSGAALPMVKIQYESGTVHGYIKQNATNDSSDTNFAFANIGLSNTINYQVTVVNGLISIAVNGVTNSVNVFQTDPAWETNTVYWKAGDYCQANGSSSTIGARVAIYALTRSHGPGITNQPASQSLTAGQNATFTVGAVPSSGTLSYQWQFDATNAIGMATNASLTITNAQGTNAGSYSVVVTDGLGSVTSAVATLGVAAAPALGIRMSGANAIISWPSGTDPGFALQTTTNLTSPAWVSAGAAVKNGGQFVVTNGVGGMARYYRLKK
jgi:hypothetical protein